jgi:hypothetical protein
MSSSSPTKIPHKLKKQELFIPSGNVYTRRTENGDRNFLGTIHRIEMLGTPEAQKYLRICEAERIVIYRMRMGEKIHGHAKISIIARLASTPEWRVSREDVLEVLR